MCVCARMCVWWVCLCVCVSVCVLCVWRVCVWRVCVVCVVCVCVCVCLCVCVVCACGVCVCVCVSHAASPVQLYNMFACLMSKGLSLDLCPILAPFSVGTIVGLPFMLNACARERETPA